MTGALELSAFDLVLASSLILATGVVSILLKLKLEKQLFIASIRTVIQLLLVGYLLKWVFSLDSIPAVTVLGLIMVIIAGSAAVSRSSRTFWISFW